MDGRLALLVCTASPAQVHKLLFLQDTCISLVAILLSIFLGYLLHACVSPLICDTGPHQGRKMLQTWRQQWASDAISRAVDNGADMWSTRAATNNWAGRGGWGGPWYKK